MGGVNPPLGVETLADRIAIIRGALAPLQPKGISWPAFSAVTGIPQGTLEKWGDGTRGISPEQAKKLAASLAAVGLGCSWEWIREGGENAPEWAKKAPSSPQDEPEVVERTLVLKPAREPIEAYSASDRTNAPGMPAWLQLEKDMQHEQALRIIREAFEAADMADTRRGGTPVLRALYGIAEKMHDLGYDGMARHIWAEMGKLLGKDLKPPDQSDGSSPTG